MSVNPENDPDGVVGRDEDEQSAEVHENTRESTEGVETTADGGADTATGLIGNGGMTDPRYLAQR